MCHSCCKNSWHGKSIAAPSGDLRRGARKHFQFRGEVVRCHQVHGQRHMSLHDHKIGIDLLSHKDERRKLSPLPQLSESIMGGIEGVPCCGYHSSFEKRMLMRDQAGREPIASNTLHVNRRWQAVDITHHYQNLACGFPCPCRQG